MLKRTLVKEMMLLAVLLVVGSSLQAAMLSDYDIDGWAEGDSMIWSIEYDALAWTDEVYTDSTLSTTLDEDWELGVFRDSYTDTTEMSKHTQVGILTYYADGMFGADLLRFDAATLGDELFIVARNTVTGDIFLTDHASVVLPASGPASPETLAYPEFGVVTLGEQIVPEPCTIALLGLGGLFLRRKKA